MGLYYRCSHETITGLLNSTVPIEEEKKVICNHCGGEVCNKGRVHFWMSFDFNVIVCTQICIPLHKPLFYESIHICLCTLFNN